MILRFHKLNLAREPACAQQQLRQVWGLADAYPGQGVGWAAGYGDHVDTLQVSLINTIKGLQYSSVFRIRIGSGFWGLLDPDSESGSRGLKKDKNVKYTQQNFTF